ncbi:MAG: DUF4830 domain-containing protein [Oscillospiraceae bacterium]|nr:DUF4830 domain-containing protein [Oscillospiraceae bacterium]
MFIYSIKASTLRFFGAIALCGTALLALVIFIPTSPVEAVDIPVVGEIQFDGVGTNEERIAFLAQFGWEVESEPAEEQQVTIPAEFDHVFVGYNELQRRQGLDLSNYRRMTVTRFTYRVTNFPDYDGVVYATLLVHRGRVIGGDICSAEPGGFVYGFAGRQGDSPK